ncbi:secretin N-terminal domain-containing protein [Deinococcus sp.]|uniref:secretin N-terminal domain-containing protein n=1 Tax=Deinococcus sp. TaxID=47478 RepID=UPI00286DA014|nr:secretin N-terminal domain-containing protein [Deinococcus sp.]
MNNRSLTLLISASLGLASLSGAFGQTVQTPAQPPAQPPPASTQSTADSRLAASNVSLEIGTYSGPLSSLLAAVAKSAGYDVIFDTDVDGLSGASSAATSAAPASGLGTAPAASAAPSPGNTGSRPVVYNFRNTPFNQVWPLLMDIYGLSYEVVQIGPGQVLRIGANPIQRVIALKNANAVDAVNQVKLFFGTPTYSEAQQKDAQGNVTGVTRTLADVKIDSPTLRIVADSRTNSLIVRGTNREVSDVQRLAAQLDQQVASAASSAATNAQTVQRVYSVKGQQADIVAVLAAQYPNLKVTAVGQTGQLVITGVQNQLDAALSLLGSVDRVTPVVTVSGPVTVQKVIQLTNAAAKDVKTVLEGTLQRDLTSTGLVGNGVPLLQADGTTVIQPPTTASSALSAAPTPATAVQVSAPQATIIADERTNTLIIRGTQAQVDQIGQIIPSLDVRVPQVNLQVRIQEINETASRSLGVDWKAGFGNFVVNVASTAVKAIFDPTQALVGFNLGATLSALENQGMTKRVYDGAVTMQSGQRSLGATSAVSNSSSSAAAHVQSGGRIELNIPSGAANVPPIQRQIDYGVTLDFYSPQVAPDGTITVRVSGKVTGEPGDVTNGQVIRFTNSEAQTTITFRAGETVLLSGLLGTNQATTNDGVPFLSSIPLIGALFGKQTTNTTRSQLLVVITGNVLQ